MAEDVTTTVTKLGKKAQNLLDKAGNMTIVKTIGKGFTEARTWIKGNISKLKSFADEVQGDIVWYDTYADAPPLYRQWDVASTIASQQNHGARARINALGFIFNIVVQNIDPDFSALGYKLTTKPRAYVYSTGNNTNKEENNNG